MRILLTNDDGVHAEGIQVLREALSDIAEVLVVAPMEERSTTGHTLTLNQPLRLLEIEKNVWGCSGFPADCTTIAIGHVAKEKKIDLVVSGINRGANLGQDIYYSGTVAAAREAAFRQIPSIGISQVLDMVAADNEVYYFSAAHFLKKFIQEGGHKNLPKYGLININVPNVEYTKLKGVLYSQLGFRIYSPGIDERMDSRNRPYFWIGGQYSGHHGEENTDCLAVEQGFVSLSLLNVLDKPLFETRAMESFVKSFIMK